MMRVYSRGWLAAAASAPAVLVVLVGLFVSGNGAGAVDDTPADAANAVTYVSDDTCAGCHAAEQTAWLKSHHAHAMEPPSEATMRGDFDDATFEGSAASYRFFRRNGKYFVETAGPDGEHAEFEIVYTFGWEPLQQYLVEIEGGRLQALTVSWDTEENRWFDLADDQAVPGDPLHWTGREYNWNFRCADCHSTDLQRNYDLETDSYATTYAAVNVGCQACHGPGSRHVEWIASGRPKSVPDAARKGFVTDLVNGGASVQLETCAQCHSRRRQIVDHHVAGMPFLDEYTPALLDEGLYFPDGQIDDEVYVYGSFLQSRMFAKGVICSDCHEPHSGELLADGNAVCTSCHNETPPERFSTIRPLAYDSPAHHFHAEGKAGSFCVDCHMPARTYMAVDPRRDHSFRVPRPDLFAATGAPDTCTGCHVDKDPSWAADAIAGWYGPGRRNEPHFGEALALGRRGAPGAGEALAAVVSDETQPAIARATAIDLLQRYLDERTAPVLIDTFSDPDPMVRLAALQALETVDPAARVELAGPLLDDPVRSVRITAARVLAPVPAESFLGDMRPTYLRAVDEYIASELAASERPESHLNLGGYWAQRGDPEKAEAEYRTALRIAPDFVPALVNLSDLKRARGLADEESELLEKAYELAPENPTVLHALGLLRVRQGRRSESLPLLARAAELGPEVARYANVHAVALESLGQPAAAARAREAALERHPYDIDLLVGLLQSQLRSPDTAAALETVNRLYELRPRDPEIARLRQQLGGR